MKKLFVMFMLVTSVMFGANFQTFDCIVFNNYGGNIVIIPTIREYTIDVETILYARDVTEDFVAWRPYITDSVDRMYVVEVVTANQIFYLKDVKMSNLRQMLNK